MAFLKKIFSGDRAGKERNNAGKTGVSPELSGENQSRSKTAQAFDISFGYRNFLQCRYCTIVLLYSFYCCAFRSDSLGSELGDIWTRYNKEQRGVIEPGNQQVCL